MIIAQCERIKPDGNRCGGVAMRGQRLCYHHIKPARTIRPKTVPPLDLTDHRQVSVALNYVMKQLMSGTIHPDVSAQMLKAIELGVNQNGRRISNDFAALHQRTGGGAFRKPIKGDDLSG